MRLGFGAQATSLLLGSQERWLHLASEVGSRQLRLFSLAPEGGTSLTSF